MRRIIERIVARLSGGQRRDQRAIEVYRRHVARALAEERWSSAEIFLDRILDVAPASTEAWLMKGFVSQHCKHDETVARMCFQKVVALCGREADHPHGERARKSLQRLADDTGEEASPATPVP